MKYTQVILSILGISFVFLLVSGCGKTGYAKDTAPAHKIGEELDSKGKQFMEWGGTTESMRSAFFPGGIHTKGLDDAQRAGFTLIELLVVIAIIGTGLSAWMPSRWSSIA